MFGLQILGGVRGLRPSATRLRYPPHLNVFLTPSLWVIWFPHWPSWPIGWCVLKYFVSIFQNFWPTPVSAFFSTDQFADNILKQKSRSLSSLPPPPHTNTGLWWDKCHNQWFSEVFFVTVSVHILVGDPFLMVRSPSILRSSSFWGRLHFWRRLHFLWI